MQNEDFVIEENTSNRHRRTNAERDDILQMHSVINNRWQIVGVVGRGSSGEVYKAFDKNLNENVAIKIHRSVKSSLETEATILKHLDKNHHFCKKIFFGKTPLNILVMELQGPTIHELRNSKGPLSLNTSLRIGRQILEALEDLHEIGYIHRDIKPTNFSIGKKEETIRTIYLLDFSLARKFVNKNKKVLPPRENTGFCGSLKYASIESHKGKDTSRVDDLWSLLYSIIELRADLPWNHVYVNSLVQELKGDLIDNLIESHLTADFLEYKTHLEKLSFTEKPNYELLKLCFDKAMIKHNITHLDKYDWELYSKHEWKLLCNNATQSSSTTLVNGGSNTSNLSQNRPEYMNNKEMLLVERMVKPYLTITSMSDESDNCVQLKAQTSASSLKARCLQKRKLPFVRKIVKKPKSWMVSRETQSIKPEDVQSKPKIEPVKSKQDIIMQTSFTAVKKSNQASSAPITPAVPKKPKKLKKKKLSKKKTSITFDEDVTVCEDLSGSLATLKFSPYRLNMNKIISDLNDDNISSNISQSSSQKHGKKKSKKKRLSKRILNAVERLSKPFRVKNSLPTTSLED